MTRKELENELRAICDDISNDETDMQLLKAKGVLCALHGALITETVEQLSHHAAAYCKAQIRTHDSRLN